MADGRSLLLIEDDETTRELLTVLLAQQGWAVTAAESGEAGLQALVDAQMCPEVMLCDQNLPGLEGPELAVALREAAPEARLLAMSASLRSTTPDGYDALLRKPFGPAELQSALERLDMDGEAGDGAVERPKVLNRGIYEQLARQMGPRTKDLYAFAMTDAEARLERMDEARRQGGADTFRREAHALKGSAGMIGAERLAAMAGAAETASLNGPDPLHGESIHEMRVACAEIRRMLERLFSSLGGVPGE